MARAIMIVEMAGRPAEHVKESLTNHVGVLDKNKDNQNFFPLKEYIINNPKTDISAVFMVASWIIRDEYWQSRNKESNNLK